MALARVGVLVIRAWVEEGSRRPLRGLVRLTADSGRGFERELVFSEPARVEALVVNSTVSFNCTSGSLFPEYENDGGENWHYSFFATAG